MATTQPGESSWTTPATFMGQVQAQTFVVLSIMPAARCLNCNSRTGGTRLSTLLTTATTAPRLTALLSGTRRAICTALPPPAALTAAAALRYGSSRLRMDHGCGRRSTVGRWEPGEAKEVSPWTHTAISMEFKHLFMGRVLVPYSNSPITMASGATPHCTSSTAVTGRTPTGAWSSTPMVMCSAPPGWVAIPRRVSVTTAAGLSSRLLGKANDRGVADYYNRKCVHSIRGGPTYAVGSLHQSCLSYHRHVARRSRLPTHVSARARSSPSRERLSLLRRAGVYHYSQARWLVAGAGQGFHRHAYGRYLGIPHISAVAIPD